MLVVGMWKRISGGVYEAFEERDTRVIRRIRTQKDRLRLSNKASRKKTPTR